MHRAVGNLLRPSNALSAFDTAVGTFVAPKIENACRSHAILPTRKRHALRLRHVTLAHAVRASVDSFALAAVFCRVHCARASRLVASARNSAECVALKGRAQRV